MATTKEAAKERSIMTIAAGDINNAPDAEPLQAMQNIKENQMVNALTIPVGARPPNPETTGPGIQSTAWTHRHKETGQPSTHSLFDPIWLSLSLATALRGATIDYRPKHGEEGSDHDPAWIVLDL